MLDRPPLRIDGEAELGGALLRISYEPLAAEPLEGVSVPAWIGEQAPAAEQPTRYQLPIRQFIGSLLGGLTLATYSIGVLEVFAGYSTNVLESAALGALWTAICSELFRNPRR